MTVLVRLGAVESRRFGFELVKPSSVVVAGAGSSATVSALGSVEFTSCESLSLNGVFQSGYDNYMLVMRHTNGGGQINIGYRLRLSGTDASGSDYTHQFVSANGSIVSGARTSSATSGNLANSYATQRAGSTVFLYGPALAQPTAVRNVGAADLGSAIVVDYASTHSLSTAYDGITLIPSGSNISGRVAVYGMRG